MVTQAQLREFIGQRPFKPFRVHLNSGEELYVTRTLQAIATTRRLVYVTPEDRLRWIDLNKIDHVQAIDVTAA